MSLRTWGLLLGAMVFGVAVLALPVEALAANVYIDDQGSNANNCSTPALAAWRSAGSGYSLSAAARKRPSARLSDA